jgi:hypothetical protein
MNAADGHPGRQTTGSITSFLTTSIDGPPARVAIFGDQGWRLEIPNYRAHIFAAGDPREWPMGAAGARTAAQPEIRKTTI